MSDKRSSEHQQAVLDRRRSSAASKHVVASRKGTRASRKAKAMREYE